MSTFSIPASPYFHSPGHAAAFAQLHMLEPICQRHSIISWHLPSNQNNNPKLKDLLVLALYPVLIYNFNPSPKIRTLLAKLYKQLKSNALLHSPLTLFPASRANSNLVNSSQKVQDAISRAWSRRGSHSDFSFSATTASCLAVDIVALLIALVRF